MIPSLQVKARVILEREHFQRLLDVLHNKEYQVVGPSRTISGTTLSKP